MKLKLDKDGHAVLQDGMPVYQYDDGTEQPFDAAATVKNYENKVANLTDEKDRHFSDKKKTEEKLKAYGKIDPDTAQKNFKLAKQLEGKQLVDEHGLEKYQKQWTEEVTASITEERDAERKQWEAEKEDYHGKIDNYEKIIYDLAVTNQFSNHPYFSGDTPKTFYKPDHAAKIFGDRFKVDIGKNKVKVYAVDNDGKQLLSKKNHGEIASFNEAVELIVQGEAEHHDIFRTSARRGPGVAGNLDGYSGTRSDAVGKGKIKAGLEKRFRGL